MLNAINLDGLNRSSLKRGKQYAAEGVAKRVTIATLKRLYAHTSDVCADFIYRHVWSDKFGHCYLQNGSGLLRVKLDDQLCVNLKVNLIAGWKLKNSALQLLNVNLKPCRNCHVLR